MNDDDDDNTLETHLRQALASNDNHALLVGTALRVVARVRTGRENNVQALYILGSVSLGILASIKIVTKIHLLGYEYLHLGAIEKVDESPLEHRALFRAAGMVTLFCLLGLGLGLLGGRCARLFRLRDLLGLVNHIRAIIVLLLVALLCGRSLRSP